MPHKWVNSSFGKGLRNYAKGYMKQFISFDAYQVFNASTYTSLLWLSKQETSVLSYVQLDRDLQTNLELERYLNNLNRDDYTPIKIKELSSDAWVLTDKSTYKILERFKRQPLQIKDIFEKIFQGIATSKDDVYFLYDCIDEGAFIKGFSRELEKEVLIEKGLVKSVLKGKDIKKYELLPRDKFIIFPYSNGTIYREEYIAQKFPNGYQYLKECEGILRNREKGRFDIDGVWFQYSRKQGINYGGKEKLITPQLSLGGQLTYDKKGEFYSDAGGYGFIKYDSVKESYKFYLTILNSKILWFFIKNTGAVFSGGYYYYKSTYLNAFPIPKINNIEYTKPFEMLVDYIMWLKEYDKNIDSYVDNAHIAKLFEDVIDAMVLELYFEKEMKEAGFAFINHAKELLKPIENLSDSETRDIINNAYQALRDKDNPIRNDLQLLPIRVPIVAPILESI